MRRSALLVVVVLLASFASIPMHRVVHASAPAAADQASAPNSLTALLELAGKRLEDQVRTSSGVIGSETYKQEVYRNPALNSSSAYVGDGAMTGYMNRREVVAKRQMTSDVAFIPVADDGNGRPWIEVRDVAEVDGNRVRPGESRIAEALAAPDAALKLRAIVDEGQAKNLNAEQNGVNVPHLALIALYPPNRAKFEFKLGRSEFVNGAQAIAVSFEERGGRSLIVGATSVKGTVWIEPQRGDVVKSVLKTGGRSNMVTIKVDFAWHAGLDQWVPARMEETSASTAVSGGMTGEATYSNFRRLPPAQPAANR